MRALLKLESTSIKPHIQENIEVQLHDQIDEAMEIKVQDQQVKVLCMEKKSLLSSSTTTLVNKPQQSKLEYQEVPHRELDINEYICVLNNAISHWG